MARIDFGSDYILRGIADPVNGNDAVNLDSLNTAIQAVTVGGLAEWRANTAYETDQIVWERTTGGIFRANSNFTSGATFDETNWTQLARLTFDDSAAADVQAIRVSANEDRLIIRDSAVTEPKLSNDVRQKLNHGSAESHTQFLDGLRGRDATVPVGAPRIPTNDSQIEQGIYTFLNNTLQFQWNDSAGIDTRALVEADWPPNQYFITGEGTDTQPDSVTALWRVLRVDEYNGDFFPVLQLITGIQYDADGTGPGTAVDFPAFNPTGGSAAIRTALGDTFWRANVELEGGFVRVDGDGTISLREPITSRRSSSL